MTVEASDDPEGPLGPTAVSTSKTTVPPADDDSDYYHVSESSKGIQLLSASRRMCHDFAIRKNTKIQKYSVRLVLLSEASLQAVCLRL